MRQNILYRLCVMFFLTGVLFFAFHQDASAIASTDELFPQPDTLFQDGQNGATLPTGDLKTDLVPQGIKILLAIAGTLAFIAFTVGGVIMVTGQGNEEIYTKAKNIFMYAAIGLAVIAGSYGLVYGIITLRLQ